MTCVLSLCPADPTDTTTAGNKQINSTEPDLNQVKEIWSSTPGHGTKQLEWLHNGMPNLNKLMLFYHSCVNISDHVPMLVFTHNNRHSALPFLQHFNLSSEHTSSYQSAPEYTEHVAASQVCVHLSSSHSFSARLAPHASDMICVVFSTLHKQCQ